MYRLFFRIVLILAGINGPLVCHAAQQIYLKPLTALLGTEISYDLTQEFSVESRFNVHVVQFLDGSYNIGFQKLDTKILEKSLICSEKILNHIRSSKVQPDVDYDDSPTMYVGVVRCTKETLYVNDVDVAEIAPPEVLRSADLPITKGNLCSPSSISFLLGFLVMEMIGTVASCPSLVFDERKDF